MTINLILNPCGELTAIDILGRLNLGSGRLNVNGETGPKYYPRLVLNLGNRSLFIFLASALSNPKYISIQSTSYWKESMATAVYAPTRKSSEDQLASYREVFSLFDKDHSGTISSDELAAVMRSLGLHASDREITYIMEKIDRDQSGTIDFEEFVLLMSSGGIGQPGVGNPNIADEDAELWEAFRVFDKDESGNICFEELQLVMENLGEKLTDEELAIMIDEADLDGDNEISFEEFKKMILGR